MNSVLVVGVDIEGGGGFAVEQSMLRQPGPGDLLCRTLDDMPNFHSVLKKIQPLFELFDQMFSVHVSSALMCSPSLLQAPRRTVADEVKSSSPCPLLCPLSRLC